MIFQHKASLLKKLLSKAVFQFKISKKIKPKQMQTHSRRADFKRVFQNVREKLVRKYLTK